jgi:L,D-transpeptidase catalytic domain
MPKKSQQRKHKGRVISRFSKKRRTKNSTLARAVRKSALARAKALEVLDSGKTPSGRRGVSRRAFLSSQPLTAHSLRNSDFPNTYIKQISVSLDDPKHWLTLSWTGPNSLSQEVGPFRTSPGAGIRGLNCDDAATSRRSGTKCTPKGMFTVEGFQRRLNSDSRATFVTWFMQRRGIALHYFPIVPAYAASHGCVRIESKHVAQLIQDNSQVDKTQVIVSGTWTKPPRQWS